MATTFRQAGLSNFQFPSSKWNKSNLFEVVFTLLDHFGVTLMIFITSLSISYCFLKVLEKLRNPRWPSFENMTLFWRHVTSSADVEGLKGNVSDILFLTFYLSSKFRCHNLNILRVKEGWLSPRPSSTHPLIQEDQKNPVWIYIRRLWIEF